MRKIVNLLFISLSLIFFGATFLQATADPVDDKEPLLDFLDNIQHSRHLNWDNNSVVCNNWIGVTCNKDRTRVIALRLPGVGLQGSIPPNTLSRLSGLQILSLRSNKISGSFPSDFLRLENIAAIYLQNNEFSGPLPSDFSVWRTLTVINLSNNAFNGTIPPSISNLTHLTSLNLANNSLSGEIPDLNLPGLQNLNLANNNLTGVVPKSLQRFPSSVFSGNNISSSVALPPTFPVEPPSPQPTRKNRKLGDTTILGIAIGGCVLVFVIIALVMFLSRPKKESESRKSDKSQKKEIPSRKKKDISERQDENQLVFFEGSNLAFDLEDLLRASAEVLGKGTFGMTYKAALEESTTVAVKRMKEVIATKREFEQQMLVIGNIRHENVAPLRAYYYSKDEKLAMYDYYEHGSVSAMLYGKTGKSSTPLSWEARLKIAIGAASGISHVHTQNGGNLVHGNIKASNIFLNSGGYGCISDIGLAALMNPLPPPSQRVAGYRAPDLIDSRKASQASDVYSYGVFLLELLTGRPPIPSSGNEEFVNLVKWVNSVVREEWTAEVFDVQLLKAPNMEEEMLEMLQIGLTCAAKIPEQRPKMKDVLKMLKGIRRAGTSNRASPATKFEISTATPTPNSVDMASSPVRQ